LSLWQVVSLLLPPIKNKCWWLSTNFILPLIKNKWQVATNIYFGSGSMNVNVQSASACVSVFPTSRINSMCIHELVLKPVIICPNMIGFAAFAIHVLPTCEKPRARLSFLFGPSPTQVLSGSDPSCRSWGQQHIPYYYFWAVRPMVHISGPGGKS
jgi:hypothetical protein